MQTRHPRRLDARRPVIAGQAACPVTAPGLVSQLSTLNSQPAARRRAFTLIELLIVIALIGLLAALLLGPVLGIFGTARVTQVTAEISSLDKAILDFKLRFGVEPPSYIVLYESAAGWNSGTAVARRNRASIQRIWPDFDFTNLSDPTTATVPTLPWNPTAGNQSIDINGNGTEGETIVLQSTEALLFFLGGHDLLRPLANNPQPLGFSVNPVNPFAASGQRAGPYHEFDMSRRSDVDQDGNPEYLDPVPGQLLPYLYFSSYEGAGYRQFGIDGTPDMAGVAQVNDEILRQGSNTGPDLISSIYMVNDQQWTMPTDRPQTQATEYINPKTYQIISPGQDFEFGQGGTYLRGQGLAVKADMTPVADIYRERLQRQREFDNITNFSGGVIGELTVVK